MALLTALFSRLLSMALTALPVMAVVLMMGAIYVVINLVVDILYFMIDKRIAYDSQE